MVLCRERDECVVDASTVNRQCGEAGREVVTATRRQGQSRARKVLAQIIGDERRLGPVRLGKPGENGIGLQLDVRDEVADVAEGVDRGVVLLAPAR